MSSIQHRNSTLPPPALPGLRSPLRSFGWQALQALRWLGRTYAFASASGAMPGPDAARAVALQQAMRAHREEGRNAGTGRRGR